MKCPRCSTENSDSNSYCHSCGRVLDPRVAALEDSLTQRLNETIKATIEEKFTAIEGKFKDAKLLEVEVAEGLAKRLVEWSKTLGIFIGIPLAILTVIFSLLGVGGYNQFLAKIEEIAKKAEEQLKGFATQKMSELEKAAAEDMQRMQAAAQIQLKAIDTRVQDAPPVRDITAKVNELTDLFKLFERGMDITAAGSPRAYGPPGVDALDYLGNAGQPGNWLGLVTDNGQPSGTPVIQTKTTQRLGFTFQRLRFRIFRDQEQTRNDTWIPKQSRMLLCRETGRCQN